MRRAVLVLAVLAALVALTLVAVPHPVQATTWSRVTYYRDTGWMAGGRWTYDGAAACGYALPLGSTVVIHAAIDVWLTCEDRGWLAPTQIDVWAPDRPWWLDADYFAVDWW